jgi:hypothetical protein
MKASTVSLGHRVMSLRVNNGASQVGFQMKRIQGKSVLDKREHI